MNIEPYTLNLALLNPQRLLNYWKWLTGDDKEIMVVTKMGDLLLKDADDKLYFLSSAEGTMDLISNHVTDFYKNRLTAKQYFEILQPEFIADIEDMDKLLKEGEVYAYIKLPLNGGKSMPSNIRSINIYDYFALISAIHKKIDSLPKSE